MPIAENLLWQDLARANGANLGQALGIPSPNGMPPLSEPIEERGEPAEIVQLMRSITQGTNIDPRQTGSQGTGMPQAPEMPPPRSLAPANPADAMPPAMNSPSVIRSIQHEANAQHDQQLAAQHAAQHQAALAAYNQAQAQSQGFTHGMPTGPGGSYSTGESAPVDSKAMLANKKTSDNNFLRSPFNRGFIDDRGPLLTSLTDGTNLAPPRMNTIKAAGATYSKEELAALSPESLRAIEGRDKKIAEDKAQIDRMQARNNNERREGSEQLKWIGDSVLGHATTEGKWQREMDSYRNTKLRDAERHADSGKGQKYRAQDERRMKDAGEDYVKVFTEGTNHRALQASEAAKAQQQAGYGVQPQEWYDQRYGPIRGGEMRSQDLAHAAHANAEVSHERNALAEGAANRGSHEKVMGMEIGSREKQSGLDRTSKKELATMEIGAHTAEGALNRGSAKELAGIREQGDNKRSEAHNQTQRDIAGFEKDPTLGRMGQQAALLERAGDLEGAKRIQREMHQYMEDHPAMLGNGAPPAPGVGKPVKRYDIPSPVAGASNPVESILNQMSVEKPDLKDPAVRQQVHQQFSAMGTTPQALREKRDGLTPTWNPFTGGFKNEKKLAQDYALSHILNSILGEPQTWVIDQYGRPREVSPAAR